ncbi:MAG: AAA family ATPase [Bryobacteraceae bacterium]
MAQPLLPDLLIEGYRGLRRLELKQLGNVNLFVGQNGVGKTSVLEAVQLYSSQAALSDLMNLLQIREEASDPANPRNFEALFFNRAAFTSGAEIKVGPRTSLVSFSIKSTVRTVDNDGTVRYRFPNEVDNGQLPVRIPTLTIEQAGELLRYAPLDGGQQAGIRPYFIELPGKARNPSNTFVNATGLDSQQFGGLWDKIVLTDFEEELNGALTHINQDIQRVSLIQKEGGVRRAIAKLRNSDRPVPFRSLGDGIYRYIGIALALANAKDGFLLVDEFENGLHYKTQEALWKFVIRMAREFNVQVFVTTHSRDCIGAFGRAAAADPQSVGMLFRLEQFRGEIVETHFEESSIVTIAENLIEVR